MKGDYMRLFLFAWLALAIFLCGCVQTYAIRKVAVPRNDIQHCRHINIKTKMPIMEEVICNGDWCIFETIQGKTKVIKVK